MPASTSDPNKLPEQRARANIDAALAQAGWVVQSRSEMNVAAAEPSVDEGETKGVALQGVNVRDFLRLPIAVPPSAEQHRITAEVERRLSVLDALEHSVALNLARCAHLRQSILKRAFSGRLVPQDPADESASALLERIRTQAE